MNKNTNNNHVPLMRSIMKKSRNIAATVMCISIFISLCSCMGTNQRIDTIRTSEPETSRASTEASKAEKTTAVEATEEETEHETEPETEPTTEGTYDSNEYFDVVERSTYRDSIGYIHIVHKVLAKQDVSASATLLAFAEDGSVLGKSSDDIVLTEGEYNYFSFSFENDISNAQMQIQTNFKTDSFMTGERHGVEMVQYNQSGDDLYITLKQTCDELGAFAKFKILFYKDDEIVDTEDGYFSIYAENLTGKDTTDVAEIWAYGTDFDRIEFIYEP